MSVLVVPHPISYENWFNAAIARKEYERALEISDLARRHRFNSSQEFGGRLMNLRWVMESGPNNSTPKLSCNARICCFAIRATTRSLKRHTSCAPSCAICRSCREVARDEDAGQEAGRASPT